MARLNLKNNAETTLASSVSASATSMIVVDAGLLPDAPYRLTIGDEIVEVTSVSGNTLTVNRAMEDTSTENHAVGRAVENRFTEGAYEGLYKHGNRFEWKYNKDSDSLDLVVIE